MSHTYFIKRGAAGFLSALFLIASASAQNAATPETAKSEPAPAASVAPVSASNNFTPLPEPSVAPITSPDLIPPPAQVATPEQTAAVPSPTSNPKPKAKPSPSPAILANAAPDFTGGGAAGRSIKLSSLRGTPVMLVIAPSPRDRSFRSQMSQLRGYYEKLAVHGMLCFAAFTSEPGRIPSNIPFILVNDPSGTANAYGVRQGFSVAVIGPDGNLDCLSARPLPGQRILDLLQNNASMQTQIRR
jgi:hypothetical protein